MSRKARIYVTLKPSLLDAQGKVVQQALGNIGFDGVGRVRIGKYIEMDIENDDVNESTIKEMCSRILANPVTEDYRFEIRES